MLDVGIYLSVKADGFSCYNFYNFFERFKMYKYILTFFLLFLCCCGGTREYRLSETQEISMGTKFPEGVSLKIFANEKYQDSLGIYTYNVYLKEAISKQYSFSLKKAFSNGLKKDLAETNIHITSLDTSIFPIAGLIIDIRVFFKIEIFDKNMSKLKTLRIYGFGSAQDGNKALEKAIVNSFHQLIPVLEELFIRS